MDLSTRQGKREQGQRIQRAVERAGISIEELANRIGCSRALLYQYVSGSTLAQPDKLQQIARFCSVSLTYFYEEEPAPAAVPAPAVSDVAQRMGESLQALQQLAGAQASPPDPRALAGTCERIVLLASQLGDRAAQTDAQERLGQSLLAIGEYLRASEELQRALVLARETGSPERERAARQSLGNALLAQGATAQAREQYETVSQISNPPRDRWRGLLALGAIDEQHGDYLHAMERFDEVALLLEEAAAAGTISQKEADLGIVYANANRTNVYMDGGDFAGARALAKKCMADAEAMGNADQFLEARFNLAWCDFHTGHLAQACNGFATLAQLARFVEDLRREAMGRAWLSLSLSAAGVYEQALQEGKTALSAALSRGDRLVELYAQIALSDAYAGINQRRTEARYHLEQALAVARALHLERAEAECRLRLGGLLLLDNASAEALEAAERALQLSQKLGARHLESAALTLSVRCAPARADAVQRVENAVLLARETGFAEALWQALVVRADLHPALSREAENDLREAVQQLETLRDELREAGMEDTLLENETCMGVYIKLLRLLQSDNRAAEADAMLEQTGWPPLNNRMETP